MVSATAAGRKLVLKMSMSLDGFVAGPNGEIDWVFRSSGGDSAAWVLRTLQEADVHIMGSGSYYDMAAFWPFSDSPMAAPMNENPKVIFSRTGITDGTGARRTPPGQNGARSGTSAMAATAALQSWTEPNVASGELAEEILRLKAQPGNCILAHGGARFAQSLVASGLVDEYRFGVHPVVLGQGLPLFTALHHPADLRLVSATQFSTGVMGMVYRPA